MTLCVLFEITQLISVEVNEGGGQSSPLNCETFSNELQITAVNVDARYHTARY